MNIRLFGSFQEIIKLALNNSEIKNILENTYIHIQNDYYTWTNYDKDAK